MKNLKKVLALVLVIASLMGMATMASATKSDDYSDADSITHIEAVDVMSTIGVFDGISGAFSGDSILTREQAAKIITYMILGKDDADALVASVAPYTDVSRDRWSAGSIAYCKNEGILAGVGNGRFEPDGKLTGVAFAKMCLVALGYDPDIQQLTGSDWAVNTSKLAIAEAGITDDLSQISLADEMSREDACQMAFNTLQADMVDYDDRGGSFTVNGANISMSASKAKPVSKDTGWADTERADGNIGGQDKIQQFAEKYFTKLECWNDNDSFGRPATTWKYKSDEIGTYVDNSQLVQSWTAKAPKGEMHSAIGGSIVSNLNDPKRDGYVLKAYVDGQYRVENDTDVFFVKNSSAAAGKTVNRGDNIGVSGNGVLTELYMDDNDNVTVVMINTYLVKASSDYNTVNQRVNVEPMDIDNEGNVSTGFLPTSISNDDFDVSGVKEGDYLLVTVSYDGRGNKYSLESVTPATLQTGTVTEYTVEDSVVMGGTKYSYNKILGDVEKGESFSINSDATLVLDTYGYIMYVDDAMVSNDFVYIDDFGGTSGLGTKAVADAYFTDGTNSEITVGKVDGVKNKTLIAQTYGFGPSKPKNLATNHEYVHWYTYSASSGGEYTLSIPSDKRYYKPNSAIATDGGYDLVKNNTVRFMNGAKDKLNPYSIDTDTGAAYANVMGNEKTIFVVKDDAGDVSTYTGVANVPTVTLGAGNTGVAKVSWISKKSDDYASFVFVDVSNATATVDGGNNIADYLFILKSTGKRTYVDGLDYYKYDVVIDGKEEERWISTALLTSNNPADDVGILFYNIKEDSDGRITSGTQVATNNSKKTHYNAKMTGNPHTITQSGNSLHILADTKLTDSSYRTAPDTSIISDLFATGKSNINLVIGNEKGKNVDDLLYDTGADYETHLGVSASYINGMLRDYYLEGNVFVVVDDDDNDVIDTMWIYVNNIEKINP